MATKEESNDLLVILNNLIETQSTLEISKKLNVSRGTVDRWILLKKVPKLYTFDLMKIAGIDIDYTKFNYTEKDQYFTPVETSKVCYSKLLEIMKNNSENEEDYIFIEPSAGNGNFLNILPKDRRIGIDIEPRTDEIIKEDYLDWKPESCKENKYIVIGNPPFGLRGQQALKFINHSSKFADYVCFILPQLFESDGKGVPRKRVEGLNLIHSEKLDTEFVSPQGKLIKIQCIYQVWSKYHKNDLYDIETIDNSLIKIYSLSDGGTPSTTRNKKMFNECDIYIPSTCFGKDNMKFYESFDELPRKKGYGVVFNVDKIKNVEKFKTIDWGMAAFLSTNSAYNIRSSQIINRFMAE